MNTCIYKRAGKKTGSDKDTEGHLTSKKKKTLTIV